MFKKYDAVKGLKTLKAKLNNNFSIEFDDTYKVKDYNYSINGNLEKSKFELSNLIKNNFVSEGIKNIYFSDLKMKTVFKPKNVKISGDGKYSFDNSNFLNINLENNLNNDILNLKLETIKFRSNPKDLSLFLEMQNPKIIYRNLLVPANSIKVYVDFLSLVKSDPIIKKISLLSEELDIVQISKLSSIIKPSNFKTLLNNKIKEGKLISEIEIFLNEDGSIKNFIAKGKVKNLKVD